MLQIDGSFGEGGGQIIRSSLALSMITGKPFRIENIRANREKPGLQNQHLTAVRAAAEISGAETVGAELKSKQLTFTPGAIRPGSYRFDIGTAGSTTLVLQTVLPALLTAKEPSQVHLLGGTHNNMAPPLDFVELAFLPLLRTMGAGVTIKTVRRGFYPAGGGEFHCSIVPCDNLARLDLQERGKVSRKSARALVSRLPAHIAERELKVLSEKLSIPKKQQEVIEEQEARGPGNVAWVELESACVTEVFSAVGEQGVTAERVAARIAREAKAYLEAGVPVGEHLADQLLLPLSLGSGGSFLTVAPSEHTRTNREIIQKFLDVEIDLRQVTVETWQVDVRV